MKHVFLSYAREDMVFARNLTGRLKDEGIPYWYDQMIPPDSIWLLEIDHAIGDAFAMAVILSNASAQSLSVTYEWGFARGADLPLIPVAIEPIQSSHHLFDFRQYLNFYEGDPPWDTLYTELNTLYREANPSQTQVPRNAPTSVKEALAALDSPTSTSRREAIDSLLQNRHNAAREALAAATAHDMQDVRIMASMALWNAHHDARASLGLVDGLGHPDPEIRQQCIGFFQRIGADSIPYLLDLFETNTPARDDAIQILTDMGQEAVPALHKALSHRSLWIRQDSARVLGKIGNHEYVSELVAMLKDPSWRVRMTVCTALSRMEDQAAVPNLIETLLDENSGVRQRAAKALGALRAEQAIDALVVAMSDPEEDVRNEARRALRSIGTPKALAALNRRT